MTCLPIVNKPLGPNAIPITKVIPPDWTTLGPDKPYYDSASGFYYVSVPLIKIPQSAADEEEIKRVSIAVAVNSLLTILSKVKTPETIAQASQEAVLADIFISLRPNLSCPEATDRALVGVPKATIDAIPDDLNAPLPIASDEIIMTTNEMIEKTNDLAKVVEELAANSGEEIKQQTGLDISKDPPTIRKIAKVIGKFLLKNGITFDDARSDLIIIGLDANNIPLYFLYDNGEELVRLQNTFNELRDLFIPRVSVYLKNLDFMIRQGNAGFGISSLLSALPDLSFPNISVDFPFANFNLSIKGIRSTYDTGKAKDEDGKDKEDKELEELSNNKDFGTKVQERLGNLFDQRFAFLDNIQTLDDVYSLLLNRTDITCFASFALECLSNNLPKDFIKCEIIKAFLRNLNGKDFVRILKELNYSIDILPEFAADVRSSLLVCYNELDDKNKKDLFDQVKFRLRQGFQDISEVSTITSTQEVIDAFGFRGKIILEEKFSSNKDKVIDDLIALIGCEAFANLNDASLTGTTLANSAINALETTNLCDLNFKLPKIPFIDFDLQLPTWDALKIIFDELALAILDGITTAFLELVKSLFEQLIRVCDEDGIPGIIDNLGGGDFLNSNIFKNALANSIGVDPSVLTDPAQYQQILEAGLRRLNVFPTITGDFGNIGDVVGSISRLMDDLGAILSPTELARLLNGNATEDVSGIIDCLIASKYPDLNTETAAGVDKKEKISGLFGTLGGLIDKTKLFNDIILINDFGDEDFCDAQSDLVKKKLLSSKGLSASQIDNELNKLRARKLQRIGQLANLIENPKFAQDFVPEICNNSSFSFNPPQMNLVLERALKGLFEGTRMTFDQEINTFVPALRENVFQNKTIKKFVDTTFEKKDGSTVNAKIVNPEWTRLVAQGFVDEIRDEDGAVLEDETNDPDRETQATTPVNIGTVAGGLQLALKSFDKDSVVENVNNGITFKVPTNTDPYRDLSNTSDFLTPSLEQFRQLAGNLGNLGAPQTTEINSLIDLAQPKRFNLKYVVGNSCEIVDRYDLAITYTQGGSPETELYKSTNFFDVPPEIENFISANNLANNISTNPPQETFLQKYFMKVLNDATNNQLAQENQQVIQRELSDGKFFALFNNILTNFSKRAAKSPLFSKNNIKNLNFTIPDKNGCEVSLLDLSKAKDEMRNVVQNSCAADIAPNTNPFVAKIGNFELSGIENSIKTLFRLYAIEFVLRNVFIFPQFNIKKEEDVDTSLISFAANEAKKDITDFGQDYYDNVEKYSIGYAQKIDPTIQNFTEAFSLIYKKEMVDVLEKMNFIVGAGENSFDISRTFAEKTLPFLDVSWSRGDIQNGAYIQKERFVGLTQKNLVNSLNQAKISSFDNTEIVPVDNENGFFILEKYAKVEFQPGFPETSKLNISSVCRLDELDAFLYRQRAFGRSIQNVFKTIKMGLRVCYVFPLKNEEFHEIGQTPTGPLSEIEISLGTQAEGIANRERAFFTQEGYSLDAVNRGNNRFLIRENNIIPVAVAELPVETLIEGTDTGQEYRNIWEAKKENLVSSLIGQEDFKFMFKFIAPIQRASSLISIFSYLYLGNLLEVDTLFDGTKTTLKRLIGTFLNSGKLDYEDADLLAVGGNAGIYSSAQTNSFDNASPDIAAIILGFILKTPIRILKGLVEITDPNIFIASKIALAARLNCKPLPVAIPSLALLPMNVFPPPPFGPGIGPPISPLGFAYLAVDAFDSISMPGCDEPAEDSYDSATEEQMRNKFCPEG